MEMQKQIDAVWQFLLCEDAPTMIEYALMAALIAVVAVSGVMAFGLAVKGNLFDAAVDAMP